MCAHDSRPAMRRTAHRLALQSFLSALRGGGEGCIGGGCRARRVSSERRLGRGPAVALCTAPGCFRSRHTVCNWHSSAPHTLHVVATQSWHSMDCSSRVRRGGSKLGLRPQWRDRGETGGSATQCLQPSLANMSAMSTTLCMSAMPQTYTIS